MSGCAVIGSGISPGLATALRQADCIAAQGGAGMFDRLFGMGGALGSVLTILLTLYVAWIAVGLLTGRSALKLSVLTPRVLGLGMILTLATSWTAYQTTVWGLLTGAPDQVAAALLGTQGSATIQFANRLDAMFVAISNSAQAAAAAPPATAQSGFTPSNMLWVAALLMLFGSLGTLLVARIALTALLGLGPVFIIFGLFKGTRGLLDGWMKAAAMFSITQLLSVLIGGEALAVMAPVVRRIAMAGSGPPMRDAVLMLLAAGVFVALMGISLKAAATIVSGWLPTSLGADDVTRVSVAGHASKAGQAVIAPSVSVPSINTNLVGSNQDRISGVVASLAGHRANSVGMRSIGLADVKHRDKPAAILPSQAIVARNRRSGDRLIDAKKSPSVYKPASARTLFR